MILVISICNDALFEYEFVRPITSFLSSLDVSFTVSHYTKVDEDILSSASHVIICGTSLSDNDFYESLDSFSWISSFDRPLLGICGGMQILGLLHGGNVSSKNEIGYYYEEFVKPFLGLSGKQEVYHLHDNYVDFTFLDDFEVFSGGDVSQAVKHKEKNLYGVLFHPEVRNKKLIENFVYL